MNNRKQVAYHISTKKQKFYEHINAVNTLQYHNNNDNDNNNFIT